MVFNDCAVLVKLYISEFNELILLLVLSASDLKAPFDAAIANPTPSAANIPAAITQAPVFAAPSAVPKIAANLF